MLTIPRFGKRSDPNALGCAQLPRRNAAWQATHTLQAACTDLRLETPVGRHLVMLVYARFPVAIAPGIVAELG